ncbi:glycosyltransferase family 2 protein [Aliarcobacter skirrowii]|uniref:Glycosyltransferase family 2 protein n=1 Tax=Aliarcobacter skirrowii TaxID=28200 RepID=A0AAW9DDC9_9BACT|nr:glycosyltransferase family 2 protein [Aliarcobacter skirrowii]MDX4070056.1 glycosyltransferase family 2 protein [Aliarcobacter skirrowii]
MLIKNISVAVLTKNNEDTITNTLNSLIEFEDVVVYDNGSKDKTMEIAKKFPNVNLVQGDFKGFGWTKNQAASFTKNDWVMIIDSDEVVNKDLLEELKTKKLDDNIVYRLNSNGYYKDIQVKYCGWTLTVKRLYNKKITSFNDKDEVHEHVLSNGLKEEVLKGSINHYSYHSISEFIIKADRYSTLFASNNAGKKSSSPAKAFFNGLYSFFRTYILKQGFRDGYVGLIIAYSHMVTNFYKYIKLYEANKELKK